MKRIRKQYIIALIFTLGVVFCPRSAYTLSDCNLRPSHGFTPDKELESVGRFNEVAVLGVIQKHFADGKVFTLEQFLEKSDLEDGFKDRAITANGHRLSNRTVWFYLHKLEKQLVIEIDKTTKPYEIFYIRNEDDLKDLAKNTPDPEIQRVLFEKTIEEGLIFKDLDDVEESKKQKANNNYYLLLSLCTNKNLNEDIGVEIVKTERRAALEILGGRLNLAGKVEKILVKKVLKLGDKGLLSFISYSRVLKSPSRIMLLKNVNNPEIRSNVARYAKDLSRKETELIEKDESMAVTMWLAEKEGVILKPEVKNKIVLCKDVMPKILLIRSGKIKDTDSWNTLLKDKNELVNAEAIKYAPLEASRQLEYASKGTFLQKVKLSERPDLTDNAIKILKNSENSYLNKVIGIRSKYNIIIESGFKADDMDKYVKYGENPSQPDIFTTEEIDLFKTIVEDKENFLFPIKITAFSKPQEFYDLTDQLADANYAFKTKKLTILYNKGEDSNYELPYLDSLEALIKHELWHDQILNLAKSELVVLAKAGGWHGYANHRLIPPQELKLKQLQGKKSTNWVRLGRNGKIIEKKSRQGVEFTEYIVGTLTKISMYPKLDIDKSDPVLLALLGIFLKKDKAKAIVNIDEKIIAAAPSWSTQNFTPEKIKQVLQEKIDSLEIRFYPGRKEVFNLNKFMDHIEKSDIFNKYEKDWEKYMQALDVLSSEAFLQLLDYFSLNTETYAYRFLAEHKYIEEAIPAIIKDKIKLGEKPINIKIVTLGGGLDPVSLGATAIESIEKNYPNLILGKDLILEIEEVNIEKKEIEDIKRRLVSNLEEEFTPKDLHIFRELDVRNSKSSLPNERGAGAKNHLNLLNKNKKLLKEIIRFKQGSITDEKLMADILQGAPDLVICNQVFYQLREQSQQDFVDLLGKYSSKDSTFLFSLQHSNSSSLFKQYFKITKISKGESVYAMKKLEPVDGITLKKNGELSRARVSFAKFVGESPKIIDVITGDASFLFKIRKILPYAELYGVDFAFEANIQAEALKQNITLLGGLISINKGFDLLDSTIERSNLRKPTYDVATLIAPDYMEPKEFFEAMDYILKPEGIVILRLDDYHDSKTREPFENFVEKLLKPGNDEVWEVVDIELDMDELEGEYRERKPIVIRRKGVSSGLLRIKLLDTKAADTNI